MRQSGVMGRHSENVFSDSLFVSRQEVEVQLLSAVCVTVSSLVPLHHEGRVLGKSGIEVLRGELGSRRRVQCW